MTNTEKPKHHFKRAGELAAVGILGGLVNPVIFTVFSGWLGTHTATLVTSGTSASTAYFLTMGMGYFTNRKKPDKSKA